ncbi:hypothetical protein PRIPAC_79700 [Pristionchus pacificus]|uniref:Uncharacterized protein n=1 Tax=Pristionchus pacificus TaxID=54126 RepID=A0A2A6CAX2_PRIPA|nr:hypothetical protein PRIPAC_79700 [Pristionchus pacificus]|eukprot:PDM75375.1 hypothetical protein PRIPAC_42552 [Pristionchus pacificus]
MIKFLIVAASLVVIAVANRPKTKDVNGHILIDLADVGTSCTDSYTGYAIVDGSLERCENITLIQKGGGEQERKEYEEYKCRVLRSHGEIREGKCVCKGSWKGPACNDYDRCPSVRPSLHAGSCSESGCAHEGIMAIGSKHLECICKDQWDGRHCERQACWRLTMKGQDKRYRNGKDGKCECGTHFERENCSVLKSCEKNGKLENGVCKCNDGYGGETCERKCPLGELTNTHNGDDNDEKKKDEFDD